MNPIKEEILQLLDVTGYPESKISSLKQGDVLEATVRFGPETHVLVKGKDVDNLVARLISIYMWVGRCRSTERKNWWLMPGNAYQDATPLLERSIPAKFIVVSPSDY